jgi:YjbE family integral membrane protein
VNLSELTHPEFWARWVAIMVLDLTLSGDNALVIALAVRNLPPDKAWRGRLWGTVGAVGLRILFTGIVTLLLAVPFLRVVGGLALLWIAFRLLVQEEASETGTRRGATLGQAIWIIVVADIVMSLDNVLAVAAAAQGDLVLIVLGVGLSIPLVVWGSGLLARLMARLPWLVDLGSAILGWVAGEMLLKDRVVAGWFGESLRATLHWLLPGALALGVVAVGRLVAARRRLSDAVHTPPRR